MRLAILTAFPPSKITLNEYGYHLVKHFRQNPEVTEIVVLADKSSANANIEFENEGCKVTILPCWKFNGYFNLFSVLKAIKQTKPDGVLFNLQFMKFGDNKIAAALGLFLPWCCKLLGVPSVVLLHNIMEQVNLEKAGITKNKLLRKTYRYIGEVLTSWILEADMVAVTINKYERILEQKYLASNLITIPHGTFELPEKPNYNLPDGPLKIMTFGKFGTYKKVEILLEAVQKLRARTQIKLEVVIAGTDNPNAPGYLQSVQEQYKHISGINFTGYVPEEQVADLFEQSAVVVFPYTSTTGSSGVLHQAGSYGKAVIMPDLGDLHLLTKEEGYQGAFFDPLSVDSLADAIEKIVSDPLYRDKLGKANYRAATAYPMSKIAKKYLKVFKELKKENLLEQQSAETVFIHKNSV